MPASIIINQSGKPAGSPSTSRDDLETGTLVTLTNATAESTYLWELLSKPVGSSASLSGATLPTATFTPDVTGSYRIRLTTNGSEVDIRIGAVKTANLDIRKPATDEETEFDSTDGWGAAHQAMIDTLDSRDAENFKRDGSIAATGDFDMGGNTLADVGGLRLQEVADPSAVADRGSVYVKDHFGDTELFYRDDSGNVVQLTKDGAVNAAGGGGSSGRVFVSSNDTNDGYLFEKIVPGLNSIVTELFDGGDEKLRVETAEVVQLPEQLSDPVFTGLDGYLYTKDVGGTTELFYMDSAGTVTQVTSDGYLDTFESLRGVGLFEQSSDPSTAVEKGFIYARTNDGYSELFYKGSHGFVAPLTRRGQVVGRHTAAVLTDEVALPGTTNITTLDPATTELASLTVDVADGERIQVNVALPIFFNTGGTGYCRLDIGGAVTGRLVASTAATGEYGNLSFPYVTDPLSAGSLTIRLLGSGAGGQNWEPVINGTMWVSRFRSDLSPTESDTALPRLVWADVSSVEVRAAPSDSINSDEVRVTLQDGKQRRFSGTLTFDFANGVGDLGLDTGSEASDTWYYLYLVPDVSNDTRLSLRASTSSPLTGPSGYANYRYIGAFRNGSAGGIRPFDQVGDWFLYRTLDGSANDEAPVIYSESGGTPSVGSWTQISLASAAPAGTAVAVRCMGQLDSDPGGAHDLVLAGSVGTPTWTPASTLSATVFLAGQENGQQANANVFQIPDGSLYRRWTQRTGAVDVTVRVQAWQDGYLNPSAQPPSVPAPDAPLPQLTYETAGSVSIAAPPGLPSTVRQTLQDGKQRSFSGTLTFDFANGVADGGLDTGSEASDTWYYLYLVPKLTDDSQLAVRASVNPPYTGPSGYTNYRYVGAIRNDSSSDLLLFYQKGDNFDYASRQIVATDTTVDVSPVQQDLTSFVPRTASHANVLLYSQTTSGFGNMSVWVTGTQSGGMAAAHFWAGAPTNFTANNTIDFVPTPGDTKEIYTQKTSTAGINGSELAINGWIDGYLVSAGGGGGGLAQTSLDGAYNNGRSITADSGPVEVDASGAAALQLDGYLTLVETSDPGALANAGSLYSKEIGGVTELFYLDDFGSSVQITDSGSIVGGSGPGFDGSYLQFNEQGSDPTPTADDGYLYTKDVSGLTELFYMDSAGTITQMTSDGYLTTPQVWEEEFTAAGGDESFVLSNSVVVNANTLSGWNIIGVFRNGLRSRFRVTPATSAEWGFSAPGTVDMKSLTGGDIITVVYEA